MPDRHLLRAALEAVTDGILVVDNDGRILTANSRFSHLWRVPPQVLSEKSHDAVLAWVLEQIKEPESFLARVRELTASPTATARDVIHLKDGRSLERATMPYVAAGVHAGRVWVCRDITDHRLAEAALRESERRARALIENSSEAIATIDPGGKVLWASGTALKLLGLKLENVRGLDMMELVHHEDITTVGEAFRQVLAGPEPRRALRARLKHGDGRWLTMDGAFTNLVSEPGILAVVVHFRDVTESLALQEQLTQSQKMEAIGRLAGGVAHDFNNLLTAIVGHAELLHEGLPEGSEAAANLAEIEKAASRAAGLTQQLLAFSRRQVLQPRELDLNKVLDGMRRMLGRLIGEDIHLDVRLGEGVGHVRADPQQMEQMLLNLVINARDAMPRGGVLQVITAVEELDEWYARRHEGVAPGRHAAITVVDTGIGMDAETQSRIFEPFFTTKKQGTGLGLSTVYGIVRQSGGHITVTSEVGKGTSITIHLPFVPAPAEPEIEPRARRVSGGSETVLVVEDEPVVRELAARILRQRGYMVLEAEGGRRALEVAGAHDGTIHLLLTDVVMPDLSGPEVAQRLKAARPRTRILYMSGYTDDAILKHGAMDASTPFLQKPFTPWGLAARVRDALDLR